MKPHLLKSALAEARERIFGAAEGKRPPCRSCVPMRTRSTGPCARSTPLIYAEKILPDCSRGLRPPEGLSAPFRCGCSSPHATAPILDEVAAAVRNFWDIGLTIGLLVRSDRARVGPFSAGHRHRHGPPGVPGGGQCRSSYELQSSCITFFTKKKAYIDELCSALREGLFSLQNTLFRVEPDLQERDLHLSDCQRLLWAERVRKGAP